MKFNDVKREVAKHIKKVAPELKVLHIKDIDTVFGHRLVTKIYDGTLFVYYNISRLRKDTDIGPYLFHIRTYLSPALLKRLNKGIDEQGGGD